MSELRDECYKCLNNQKCLGGAEYGSLYCMMNRRLKMQNEEDSVYTYKFATMQKQIDEKDKRIQELEEENRIQRKQIMSAYNRGWIPKQKVKDKIEEIKLSGGSNGKDNVENLARELVIEVLEELLEEK